LDPANAQNAPLVAGWAPGINMTRFPQGTGVRLVAGRKMIMQVHYNLDNATGADQTAVHLSTRGAVDNEAFILGLADTSMVLPPGEANAAHDITWRAPAPFTVHGVFPHMHTLGASLTVRKHAGSGGSDQCVIDVPHWDFEWQQFFFYEQDAAPMRLAAGDALNVTCRYDTRSRTEPIPWGDGTQDEMCVSFFYVTP
jgi:hypothetical protein